VFPVIRAFGATIEPRGTAMRGWPGCITNAGAERPWNMRGSNRAPPPMKPRLNDPAFMTVHARPGL
jgi:hypothetical protein